MEFSLETIVEQLLVGALVSLLVLSAIFFMFGHIWNVSMMRRFFDTLFGERLTTPEEHPAGEPSQAVPQLAPDERSEATRSKAHRSVRQPKHGEADENHLKFGLILLLAILYGLGLLWEAGSHTYLHEDNVELKRAAFYDVASGKLKSGTASHRLASFVADYNACRSATPKGAKKDKVPSLCHQIDERVTQFFYNAKNVVFQHREYYEELSIIEARINFMLSFHLLTKWFFLELCAVFVIALIAEVGSRNSPGSWKRRMDQVFGVATPAEKGERRKTWREEWKKGFIDLGTHWVGIAAFHILLLAAVCFGLQMLSKQGCDYSEDQFAKRVFGYYLALQSQHLGAKENGEGTTAEAPEDLTPESPYHVFSLLNEDEPPQEGEAEDVHHHKQRRLEPSAVQILGNTSRVLVASDQGEDEPFWLFTLNEDATRMEHPQALHVGAEEKPLLRKGGTIESLAAFEVKGNDIPLPERQSCAFKEDSSTQGEHKLFRVFAGPDAFRAGSGRLLSFCLEVAPSARPDESPTISKLEEEQVPPPCKAAFGQDTETCSVEGIAFRFDGQNKPELLLGVQKAETAPDRHPDKHPTVAIVRLSRLNDVWSNPEKIFPAPGNECSSNPGLTAMLGERGVISDLAATPSGQIYVTTSVQGQPASDRKEPAAMPQVGGALWEVDLGCKAQQKGDPCHCSDQRATLLERFIHKPDGVSHDNGSVLVVFDDEAGRKSTQWAPRTFPLAQNESVFAVVPAPVESK